MIPFCIIPFYLFAFASMDMSDIPIAKARGFTTHLDKISHDIIKTAIAHDVKVIKLERLANIRSTTRISRKNNPSLHTWSFYRLTQFIEYKAKLAGIKVEYVNPAYTSQKCPVCGNIHHANDRNYTCSCGFHIHRDVLGAINICSSTEYVGDSNIRHTA